MDGDGGPAFQVNEHAPDPAVAFDRTVATLYIRYARMLAARGYVQGPLGGMVIRVAHPNYPSGICYAKPAGVSLEDVEADDLVITDVPYGRILYGERPTTVGHQMNREILRLRHDVNCVIHLHHDETIAFLAAGHKEMHITSITYPVIMQKPAHYLPAHVNVEAEVAPIKEFIQHTNCIVMPRHGITVLGRNVAEAYYRTNEWAAEAKRNVLVASMTAAKGAAPDALSQDEMEWSFKHSDSIVHPTLVRRGPRA